MSHREGWEIEKEILLPEGVKSLRLDPGYRACMTEIRKLAFDGQTGQAPVTLAEGKFRWETGSFSGRMIRTFI